jgi:hypothetical protein
MGHEYADVFRFPAEVFGIVASDILAVDIAGYAAQGFEGSQAKGELRGPEVAGVPDLVAGLEMPKDSVIEIVVGIG